MSGHPTGLVDGPQRSRDGSGSPLDLVCDGPFGTAIRPVLRVAMDARTRMVVDFAIALPPDDGPTLD